MDADVLIIGAGPSGSVAARLLTKLGYKAIILEKEQFPRFSIGESLLPQCMEFLEAADLLSVLESEGFQLKNGAAFSHAGKLTEFDFSQKFSNGWSTTYQVQRARFDQVLADAAENAGAPIFYRHTIVAADFDKPGLASLTTLDQNGARRDWTAALVMDASGFGRVLPRLLDLETPSGLRERQALFTHIEDRIFDNSYDREKILIGIHPEFHEIWYWLIPFSNGRSSLGVVAPAGFLDTDSAGKLDLLRELVFAEPRLAELLGDACFDTPVNEIGGYSANVSTLHGQGFVLLGNAGEFLDPVFSSGVTIALKSSVLAVSLADKQFRGIQVDWRLEYEQVLRQGIAVFRAYVNAWYDGKFQRLIFDGRQMANIKSMICAILAGFAWDETNPMTQRPGKKIEAMVESCPPL